MLFVHCCCTIELGTADDITCGERSGSDLSRPTLTAVQVLFIRLLLLYFTAVCTYSRYKGRSFHTEEPYNFVRLQLLVHVKCVARYCRKRSRRIGHLHFAAQGAGNEQQERIGNDTAIA